MWIPQFRCHVETELVAVLDRGIAESYHVETSRLEDLLQEKRLESRV